LPGKDPRKGEKPALEQQEAGKDQKFLSKTIRGGRQTESMNVHAVKEKGTPQDRNGWSELAALTLARERNEEEARRV